MNDNRTPEDGVFSRGEILRFPGKYPRTENRAFVTAYEELRAAPKDQQKWETFLDIGEALLQRMELESKQVFAMGGTLSEETQKLVLKEISERMQEMRDFCTSIIKQREGTESEEDAGKISAGREKQLVANAEAVLERNHIYTKETLEDIVRTIVIPHLDNPMTDMDIAGAITDEVLEKYPPEHGHTTGEVISATRGRVFQYLCAKLAELRMSGEDESAPALSGTYTIQSHDTLWGILEQRGVPEKKIEVLLQKLRTDPKLVQSIGIESGKPGLLEQGAVLSLDRLRTALEQITG